MSDADRNLGMNGITRDRRSVITKSYQLDSVHMAELALDVREIPRGSNDSPRIRVYQDSAGSPRNSAWCAAYAYWAHRQVNIYAYRSAYCPTWAVKGNQIYNGGRYERPPLPGDWILIWGNKAKRYNHITSIHASDGDDWITIGGNETNKLRMGRMKKNQVVFIGTYLN